MSATPARRTFPKAEPKPLDKSLSAVIDYDRNANTFGGLIGQWEAVIRNAAGEKVGGCIAGRDAVLEHCKREGVWALRIRYTERARPYKRPSR